MRGNLDHTSSIRKKTFWPFDLTRLLLSRLIDNAQLIIRSEQDSFSLTLGDNKFPHYVMIVKNSGRLGI